MSAIECLAVMTLLRMITKDANNMGCGPADHACGERNVEHVQSVQMWLVASGDGRQQFIDTFALTHTQCPTSRGLISIGP